MSSLMLDDDKWSEAGLWDALRKFWWEDPGGIVLKELYDLACSENRNFQLVDFGDFGVFGDFGGGDHGCDETSRAGPCNQIKVLP